MAPQKRQSKGTPERVAPPVAPSELAPVEGPLRIAKGLSAALAAIGLVMFSMGVGVAVGKITEGWGFPMSAVPNWGRPWGLVLMAAGAIYVIGPALLVIRKSRGPATMMIIAASSVLLGTPLITTTAEIVYNLFQQTKSRPDWIDSVWAYFIMLNIGICVALYRAYPAAEGHEKPRSRTAI